MLKSDLLLVFLMMLGLVCRLSYGQYSSGTGTAEDPYQIATAQDLVDLGNNPNDYDKHFVLSADIDLSGYTFEQAVIASYTETQQSKFGRAVFSGSFDGKGHRIANLTITGESYLGLFGGVQSQGKVSNLGIVDVNVISTGEDHENIGGLVGINLGSVVNCYSTGSVTGDRCVGGLVGYNRGRITTSFSTCSVTGDRCVGGLVGQLMRTTIATSFSTGSVAGQSAVGGLVGYTAAASSQATAPAQPRRIRCRRPRGAQQLWRPHHLKFLGL